MAFGKIATVAASFLLPHASATPCVCEASWESPTPGCSNVSGCPAVACDGVSKPWCKVAFGCDDEMENEGWAWCGPGPNGTGVGIELDPAFAGNPDKECKDVSTDADHLTCYRGVTWAKNVGLQAKPEWYTKYNLTSNSSRLDIQCALSDMVGPSNGSKGHNCPVPCNSDMPLCAGASPEEEVTTPVPGTTTTASSGSGSSSFPWWAWLLIALGLAACLGGLAWYFLAGPGAKKSAAKKKKRGATKTKKETPAKVEEKAAAPAEAAPLVAPPIYTYVQQPMQAMAQPMVQYATQPMQYATASAVPIQSISTMSTAMPMAVPMQQATTVYQQASSVAMPTFG